MDENDYINEQPSILLDDIILEFATDIIQNNEIVEQSDDNEDNLSVIESENESDDEIILNTNINFKNNDNITIYSLIKQLKKQNNIFDDQFNELLYEIDQYISEDDDDFIMKSCEININHFDEFIEDIMELLLSSFQNNNFDELLSYIEMNCDSYQFVEQILDQTIIISNKHHIIEDQIINTENIIIENEIIENSNISTISEIQCCKQCNMVLNCHNCLEKQQQFIKNIDEIVVESKQIQDDIIISDIQINNFGELIIISDDNITKIQPKYVTIKLPVQNQPKNEMPIQKYTGEFTRVKLTDYNPNYNTINENYSHCGQYNILSKIMHDNNLKCGNIEYNYIYYDIETYNDNDFNSIPQKDNINSHIAMISCVIYNKKQQLSKTIFCQKKNYKFQNVNKDINIILCNSEVLLCQEFLSFIAEYKNSFLIGYNSSASIYSEFQSGYDLPFILARSQTNITVKQNKFKTKIMTTGNQITKINQLQSIYPIDYMVLVSEILGIKNKIPNFKLDTVAEYFIKQNKLDHNYQDLQKQLSNGCDDISDIVNYCVFDSEIIHRIEQSQQLIGLRLQLQEILQTPISQILYRTINNNATHKWQQLYIENCFIVQYQKQNYEEFQFSGAYCNTNQDILFKTVNSCLAFDYQSLYPSIIIDKNISIENYHHSSEFITEQDNDLICIDISDDIKYKNTYKTYYNFFTKNESIVPQFLDKMLQDRNQLKKQMVELKKQIGNENIDQNELNQQISKINNQQEVRKLINNSQYGNLSSKNSLIFSKYVGESVTSFGRTAALKLRSICEQQQQKWLFSDTDSCFIQMSENIQNHNDIIQLTKNINQQLANDMKTDRLVVGYDEIIKNALFIQAKKNYIIQQILPCNFDKYNYNNTYFDDVKQRGVINSKLSKFSQKLFDEKIQEFMGQNKLNGEQYYKEIEQYFIQLLDTTIQNNDLEMLSNLSETVKIITKNKNSLKLQSYYENIQQSHCNVVYLNCNYKKHYENIIPVDKIDNYTIKYIDKAHILNNQLSMYKKFLVGNQNKNISKFKTEMNNNIDEMQQDDILIREEKINNYQKTSYKTILIKKNDLVQYITQNQSKSLHEIFTNNIIKLSIDLDNFNGNIDQFCDKLQQQFIVLFQKQCKFYILKNSDKNSYHIYTDFAMEVSFMRNIMKQISYNFTQSGLCNANSIDLNIYREQASLRLPLSNKIQNNTMIYSKYVNLNQNEQINNKNISKYLVNDIEDCFIIQTPLNFINHPVIDSELILNLGEQYTDQHKLVLQQYLYKNGINYSHFVTNKSRINVRGSIDSICPFHNKQHTKIDFLFADCSKNSIKISCYRRNHTEKIINYSKTIQLSEIEAQQTISRIQIAVNTQNQLLQNINNSIQLCQKYLNIPFENKNELIYIKSSLGTGKSTWISKYIEQNLEKTCLIISPRKTLTNSVIERYQCVNYQDLNGSYKISEKRRVCSQLESINRILDINSVDILILDEIESIISQLQGNVSLRQQISYKFIQLLQNAKQIIIADGLLMNNTIQLLQQLSENRSHIIYENNFKPYENNIVQMIEFTKQSTIRSEICELLQYKLSNNKKVVCFVTSNKNCNYIYQQFKNDYNVKIYTGDDMQMDENNKIHYENKQNDLKDVNTAWKCDLLIYSSTITCGVDFNIQHFDEFISVLTSNTCDSIGKIQGLFRVRKYTKKQHIIFIQDSKITSAKTPYNILKCEFQNVIKDKDEQLRVYLQSRSDTLECNSSQFIVKQLQRLGFTVNYSVLQNVNKITLKDNEIDYTIQITEQHCEMIQKIDRNSDYLLNEIVPSNILQIHSKIKLLNSLSIKNSEIISNPKYNDQQYMLQLEEYQKKLIYYNQIQQIGNSVEQLYARLNNEINRKQNNITIKDTKIDLFTIPQQIESMKNTDQILLQLIELQNADKLNSDEIKLIKNSNINFDNTKWCSLLQNKLKSLGYSLEKLSKTSRNNNKRTYYYNLIQFSNLIQ